MLLNSHHSRSVCCPTSSSCKPITCKHAHSPSPLLITTIRPSSALHVIHARSCSSVLSTRASASQKDAQSSNSQDRSRTRSSDGSSNNRGRSGGGRGGAGRSGGGSRGTSFAGNDLSPEDKVPSLEACLQSIDDACITPLPPNPTAYLMYDLGKRADMDKAKLGSSGRSDVLDRAEKGVQLLLGVSSSSPSVSTAAAAVPVQQLDSKHLSLLAWALSALARFDQRVLSSSTRQLCYALAGRAAQPGVMDSKPDVACRNLAGVLYGLAGVGITCADDKRVAAAFTVAIEQQLPELLSSGKKCVAQDVSNTAIACKNAKFEGKMQPLISAIASRVSDPSMGGVGGGIMARAQPQAWSNLISACAHLVKQGGEGRLGDSMPIIASEGAAAMVRATRSPARFQPNTQNLANMLWGLSVIGGWNEASVIRALAAAFVQQISSSNPQQIANVLLALVKFQWFDQGDVSTLAAEIAKPERISSSTPQAISNGLWALSTLGWCEADVYDKLLAGLVGNNDTVPQDLSNAMYSCAIASHHSSSVDSLAQLISSKQLGDWNDQDVLNALYTWAVLSVQGLTSHSMEQMAQHLLQEVNSRGPAAFKHLEMSQLHSAHLEAERVGLAGGGLSTANRMQQAAAERHWKNVAELQHKHKQSAAEKQVVAALREAGYKVEVACIVGGDYFVEMLVHDESCSRGVAVDVVEAGGLLRHPWGQMSGKVMHTHAQIRQRCDGLVVLSQAEARQPSVIVQKVQAELRRASGMQGQGVSVSVSPSPVSESPPVSAPSLLLQPGGKKKPTASKPNDADLPQLKARPQRSKDAS